MVELIAILFLKVVVPKFIQPLIFNIRHTENLSNYASSTSDILPFTARGGKKIRANFDAEECQIESGTTNQ